MASINVFEELRLYNTSQERENYENMATLFSLISCLDYLERAYVRGAVGEDEYAPACARLLGQYKTMIKLITDPNKPPPHFRDVDAFMAHFGMDQPAAAHRVKVGVPATVEHAAGDGAKPGSAERTRLVAETTQNFITLMDALKLKLRAKDQLHPLFGDLLASYTKVGAEVGETRAKLLHWLIKLNQMSASEEVDEQAAREMLFDVEQAYNAWFSSLRD